MKDNLNHYVIQETFMACYIMNRLLKKYDQYYALLHKNDLIKAFQTRQTVTFAAKFKVNNSMKN